MTPNASDLVLLGAGRGAWGFCRTLIAHLPSRTLRLGLFDALGLLGDAHRRDPADRIP